MITKFRVSLALAAALACAAPGFAQGPIVRGGDACNHEGGCPRGPIGGPRPLENESTVSDAQLNAAMQKIRRDPKTSRALLEALRRGDQVTAANIMRDNGAPPPPDTLMALGSGVNAGGRPEDLCVTQVRYWILIDGVRVQRKVYRYYFC